MKQSRWKKYCFAAVDSSVPDGDTFEGVWEYNRPLDGRYTPLQNESDKYYRRGTHSQDKLQNLGIWEGGAFMEGPLQRRLHYHD